MSILDRELARAVKAGVAPNKPCDAAGMALVLTNLDLANRVNYKPGMAELWADSMSLWCVKRHREPFTYTELAAAVLDMTTTTGSGFAQPAELWRAVGAFQASQIQEALAGRREVPLPEITEGWTGERTLAYQAAWRKAVLQGAATDGEREAVALAACQLTPAPDSPRITKPLTKISSMAVKAV